MKIYRRLSQFGSKLAIFLQEPLRSTVPSVPPCVTWTEYLTARCAKSRRVSLQPISQATVCEPLLYGSVAHLARTRCWTIAAHLTAVYHSCAGYSIVKILCPLIIENWERRFDKPFRQIFQKFLHFWKLPSTYRGMGEAFCSPFFKNFVTMHKPRHMAAVYFAIYS